MAKSANPISDKQKVFVLSLLEERGMTMALTEEDVSKMTSWDASATIKQLLALPKVATSIKSPKNDHGVTAGRYALEFNGELKFYRVDCPTDGKWAGYTFLKVQASDDYYPVKNPTLKAQVLERIAEDPAAASKRYGQEIGSCGVCGRTLTDEVSREYGIGPVCRENTGW